MSTKLCSTCKWCVASPGGDIRMAKCSAVKDPVTGVKLPVGIARRDEWEGYKLTCGYAGALWEAIP